MSALTLFDGLRKMRRNIFIYLVSDGTFRCCTEGYWGKLSAGYSQFWADGSSYARPPAIKDRSTTKSRISRVSASQFCMKMCATCRSILPKTYSAVFFRFRASVLESEHRHSVHPLRSSIDPLMFQDTADVYVFLKAMKRQGFIGCQQRFTKFLRCALEYPFSSDFFAETIVDTIVHDIGP